MSGGIDYTWILLALRCVMQEVDEQVDALIERGVDGGEAVERVIAGLAERLGDNDVQRIELRGALDTLLSALEAREDLVDPDACN